MVRDAGQDGMNFWLSRGALVPTLVNYLVSKILGKIQGTEMLDLENLGTR